MKINEINEDYELQLLSVENCCKLRPELPADKTKNKKIKK